MNTILGIAAACFSSQLTKVGTVISKDTIYVEFLCITDWNKNDITLQDGETVAYRWVSREVLLHMKKDELVTERMQKFISELQGD